MVAKAARATGRRTARPTRSGVADVKRLFAAIEATDLAGFQTLVADGADINASHRGYTPLHALIQSKPHAHGAAPTAEAPSVYAASLIAQTGGDASERICVGADGGRYTSLITGFTTKFPTSLALAGMTMAQTPNIGTDPSEVDLINPHGTSTPVGSVIRESLRELGEAIVAAASAAKIRVAVIASGDMSHRLKSPWCALVRIPEAFSPPCPTPSPRVWPHCL